MLLVAFAGLVTVTFAPLPLPQALERLSAATGQKLLCAPALRDEVLLARLKDADEERVLREVAACFDAMWETTAEGRMLKPDPVLRRTLAAQARRRKEAAVARSMAEIAERLAKQPRTFGAAEAAAHRKRVADAANSRGKTDAGEDDGGNPEAEPAWRATARLVAVLGPARFLGLRPGERVVMAERPTPAQVAFPLAAQGVLATYRTEAARLDPLRRAARIRFVVQAGFDGDYDVQFLTLDRMGNVDDGASVSIRDKTPDEKTVEPKKPPVEHPFVMPEESMEYFGLINSRQNAVRGEAYDRWKERFADPVTFEPTTWYPGLALTAAARTQGRNLIGTVSDFANSRFERPLADTTPSAFLALFVPDCRLRDGWLICKPELYHFRTAPRAEAGALFRHALAQGGLDIDAGADWFVRHPRSEPSLTWVGAHLSALLSGRGPSSLLATFDEDSLGLWGAFGPSVRSALREGKTLPIPDLPPPARQAIWERIYWGGSTDVEEREITEALPYGLVNGTVSLKVAEEPVAFAWSEALGEPVFRSPMTADAFGTQMGRTQRRQAEFVRDRFRLGTTRNYVLTFAFRSERFSFEHEMTETFLPPGASAVDRLPEAFKRRAEVARLRTLNDPEGEPLPDLRKP